MLYIHDAELRVFTRRLPSADVFILYLRHKITAATARETKRGEASAERKTSTETPGARPHRGKQTNKQIKDKTVLSVCLCVSCEISQMN